MAGCYCEEIAGAGLSSWFPSVKQNLRFVVLLDEHKVFIVCPAIRADAGEDVCPPSAFHAPHCWSRIERAQFRPVAKAVDPNPAARLPAACEHIVACSCHAAGFRP